MSREGEPFLARWSRRKAAETPDESPAAGPAEPADETPAQKPDEVFDLSKLPSIESLGQHSDYSMFMHKAVPDDLRLQALRRMWTTDPVLAAPDLLDMHQLDYTGNDGIRPLVHPALDAIAAAARELLERSRDAVTEKAPPAESKPADSAQAEPSPTPPPDDRG